MVNNYSDEFTSMLHHGQFLTIIVSLTYVANERS